MRVVHLLRKPCSEGTVAGNVLRWGAGAVNVDGCRIGSDGGVKALKDARPNYKNAVYGKGFGGCESEPCGGRWPANFLLRHLPGCGAECEAGCPVRVLDAQSGASVSRASDYNFNESNNDNPARVTKNIKSGVHFEDAGGASRFFWQYRTAAELLAYLRTLTVPDGGLFVERDCAGHGEDTAHAVWLDEDTGEAIREAWRVLRPGGHLLLAAPDGVGHRGACVAEDLGFEVRDCLFVADDAGDRFWYVAKPATSEREEGTDSLELRRVDHGRDPESVGANNAYQRQNSIRANVHPTVKPVAIMAELIASTCARGDLVVDPFLGSGTTGIAALQEEMRFVGIERDPEYVEIARARVAHWRSQQQPTLFGRLAGIGGVRYTMPARRT